MTFTKDKTQAKNYLAVIHELASYSPGSSTGRILECLSVLPAHDEESRTSILETNEGKISRTVWSESSRFFESFILNDRK